MLLEVTPQNVRRHKPQHAAQGRHDQRGRKPDYADADQRPGKTSAASLGDGGKMFSMYAMRNITASTPKGGRV